MKSIGLKQIKIIIVLCLIYTNSLGQAKFEIYGTTNLEYDGAPISLLGQYYKKTNFSSISTKVKNGKFYLSDKMISAYQKVYLSILINGKSHNFDFFIKKGKQSVSINYISENDSFNNVKFFDAPFQQTQANFTNFIKPVLDSNKRFDALLSMHNNSTNAIFTDSLNKIQIHNIKRLLDKKIQFIINNPNSYFSLYEFRNSIITTSTLYSARELNTIFLNFSNKLRTTELGKEIFVIIKKKKSLVLNKEIVNFSFTSSANKKYSLSQFRDSQYILLCFWASWCAPCKKNIPLLKDVNLKYSEKGLQLISVSIDDDKSNWLNALQKYEMPWIQTCDIKPFINEKETIRNRYYIHAVPQYFLIDKNGIIIYHNLQMKDEDYNLLSKTLESIFSKIK